MSASDEQVGGTHYKDMAIQPSEFSQRNRLNWCEANVVKYVCRHRAKNGRQDVEKAIHYLQLLLEWEYPTTDHQTARMVAKRGPCHKCGEPDCAEFNGRHVCYHCI